MLFNKLFGDKKASIGGSQSSRQAASSNKSDLVEKMKTAEKILWDRDKRNYKLAEDILFKCSEANVRGAAATLGLHYLQSDEAAKVKQGYDMLLTAHASGDSAASNKLGFAYAKGILGDPDHEKAMEYYGVAANAGDGAAAFNLGVMFLNGQGVNIDFEKAREWFGAADSLGNKAAARPLAYIDFATETFEQERQIANALGRDYSPNIPDKSKAETVFTELKGLLESDESILHGLSTTAMGMGVSINGYASVQKALTLMRNLSFYTGIPYEAILSCCAAEEIDRIEEHIEKME